ncbi:MAG: ATP-binding protein [Flavobacteriaceae bacterium]|nr:ATP-binding protein [Flavobacteriaceae bacterium]
MQRKIVITGGPGTGKSTVIDELLHLNYECMPEISREITLEAKKNGVDQLFLKNPHLFSQLLLEGREKQYNEALVKKSTIIFFDRGIPDVHAYMNYLGVEYSDNYIEKSLTHRYSHVFIMPPWERIYTQDNERYESFEQSLAIHNHLKKTYLDLNYKVIEVPTGTVQKRVNFILNMI